jgi:hypothetical protein
MKKPPCHDGRRHDQKTKHLVATVETPLLRASRILGFLLQVWLYPAFDHGILIACGYPRA